MQESYHLFPAAASVASTAPANFSSVSENGASGGVVSGVAATYLNANRNMLSQYTTPQTAGVAASSPISTSSATPPPPASSATVSSASPQPGIGNDQFWFTFFLICTPGVVTVTNFLTDSSANWSASENSVATSTSASLSDYSRFASYNGMAAAAAARESAYFGSAGAAAAAANSFPYAAYAQNMMNWNSYSLATYQGLQREGVTYGKNLRMMTS